MRFEKSEYNNTTLHRKLNMERLKQLFGQGIPAELMCMVQPHALHVVVPLLQERWPFGEDVDSADAKR